MPSFVCGKYSLFFLIQDQTGQSVIGALRVAVGKFYLQITTPSISGDPNWTTISSDTTLVSWIKQASTLSTKNEHMKYTDRHSAARKCVRSLFLRAFAPSTSANYSCKRHLVRIGENKRRTCDLSISFLPPKISTFYKEIALKQRILL
eukprot:TRINITY_DN134_c3_g1_i8.p2 TRINITY_DN134_c3_g1~~TRINITY_DN134_c3_g1_i8.p2  ORF type:complete len:148 (+),score=1.85 TRINITY_DN134_c3_g1_i8:772-1215(+)